MAEVSNIKKNTKAVMPERVKIAEAARNRWAVTVEPGTTRDQLKLPEFWSLNARLFIPGDFLEVISDDMAFYAEYKVLSCDRTWAKVHELSWHDLTTPEVSLTEIQSAEQKAKHSVEWRGPHLLFCVERKDGDKVERLKEKCKDRAEATLYLENHLKTVGV